jgi:hypothetical protein
MSHVYVSAFQPFASRRGVDTVLALRFKYDPDLIATLKDALQEARSRGYAFQPGGWLAEERCWFVERQAWPCVRSHLRDAGYSVFLSPGVNESEEPPPGRTLDVRSIIKSWYREMSMRYHPDRTLGSDQAMKAINHGYERLLELLGVTR